MSDLEAEARATYERYVAARERVMAGELGWDALADFFTEDATFIDPAWGRVEGLENIRQFLKESMAGLETWTFPHEWTLVDGPRVVSFWQNRLPGRAPDEGPLQAPGISVLHYAGNGKFSYELDVLNMVQVTELIAQSGWRPGPSFNMPPRKPRR
jgi:ketosteroid isomerase-like protein